MVKMINDNNEEDEDIVDNRAIFVWRWKMVSVSVCYLFYRPMDEKTKHGLFIFPPKKTLIWGRYCWLTIRVAAWRQSEVSVDFQKVLRHDIFSPERSLDHNNPPKATHVCIRWINQSNRSISVRLLFLFCSPVFISRSCENRSNDDVDYDDDDTGKDEFQYNGI